MREKRRFPSSTSSSSSSAAAYAAANTLAAKIGTNHSTFHLIQLKYIAIDRNFIIVSSHTFIRASNHISILELWLWLCFGVPQEDFDVIFGFCHLPFILFTFHCFFFFFHTFLSHFIYISIFSARFCYFCTAVLYTPMCLDIYIYCTYYVEHTTRQYRLYQHHLNL